MVTVSTEGVVSVGGAYYKSYTFEEEGIKIGDIIKAKMVDKRGSSSVETEVDLEVTQELLDAVKSAIEQRDWDNHIAELKSKRPTLYAYQLDYDFDSLSEIINARQNFNMHDEIVDAVDRGGYVAKHYTDEDGNDTTDGDEWSDEYDEERYWREIDEYIAGLDLDDIESFLCYDMIDWTDAEIEELQEKKERREDNEETDTEEYQYICRLLDKLPDKVVLLTEEQAKKYVYEEGGHDIVIDGFGYLQMDSI